MLHQIALALDGELMRLERFWNLALSQNAGISE